MRSAGQVFVAALAVALLAGPAVASEDKATPDLLPGVDLVTEEVEPGVYRVLGDGTSNELGFGSQDTDYGTSLVAGQDGSVWIVDGSRVFRIGTDGWVDPRPLDPWRPDISIAPDGTVWVRGPDPVGGSRTLSMLTRGSWSGMDVPPHDATITDIDAAADGTVWATLLTGWTADACAMNPQNEYGGGQLAIARYGSEWRQEPIEPEITVEWAELVVGPEGPEFLGAGPCHPEGQRLLERHEDGWAPVDIPGADGIREWSGLWPVEIGPDGTVWAWTIVESDPWWTGSRLFRRTDGEWEVFGVEQPVPMLFGNNMWVADTTVSADGRLWVAFDEFDGPVALDHHRETESSVMAGLDGACPGVLSFDGASWTHHLDGACVSHVSAAPNGNTWVAVEDLDAQWFDEWSGGDRERALRFEGPAPAVVPAGIYVITPEAVAAAE